MRVRGAGGSGDAPPEKANSARLLHSLEQLHAHVGPAPSNGRQWWHEWLRLMAAETAHTGQAPVDMRNFMRGGNRSITALVRDHAPALQWLVDAGWSPKDATAVMLLLSCGAATLGHTLREHDSAFAASAHALCDALRQRSSVVSKAAPPTFAAIEGTFGLGMADPAWLALLREGPEAHAAGYAFTTKAPVQASTHPTRLVVDAACSFPVHRLSSAACELRDGATLVCFLSHERTCRGDAMRSLIQVGPHAFALPPLATIRLVATLEAGTWSHEGETVRRRCVCVSVGVAF